MIPSAIPTVVVVVSDGTVETAYYSDQPVRLVLVKPDLVTQESADAVSEPIVFDLTDANFPSSVVGQVKAVLDKASIAAR